LFCESPLNSSRKMWKTIGKFEKILAKSDTIVLKLNNKGRHTQFAHICRIGGAWPQQSNAVPFRQEDREMTKTAIIMMTAFLAVLAGLTQADTLTVGLTPGYDYATIQAAIDDSNDVVIPFSLPTVLTQAPATVISTLAVKQ
jgi:hypothetical protein